MDNKKFDLIAHEVAEKFVASGVISKAVKENGISPESAKVLSASLQLSARFSSELIKAILVDGEHLE